MEIRQIVVKKYLTGWSFCPVVSGKSKYLIELKVPFINILWNDFTIYANLYACTEDSQGNSTKGKRLFRRALKLIYMENNCQKCISFGMTTKEIEPMVKEAMYMIIQSYDKSKILKHWNSSNETKRR